MKSKRNLLKEIKKKSIELVTQSTSHGLPKIFLSQSIILKLVWLVLFFAFSSMGIWKVVEMTTNYLAYEVITNIDLINENSADFPTITFYNQKNVKANNSIKDILIFCQFAKEECNESYFETIQDKYGFISYKFKKRKTYISGIQYGLLLVINISTTSLYSLLGGVRVVVHNESIDPRYHNGETNYGVDLSPGFFTSVSVSRVVSSKLSEPYNDCLKYITSINSYDSELYRYIIQNTSYSYTQKDCIDYCIGREFYRHFNISNKIDNLFDVWESGIVPSNVSLNLYLSLVKGDVSDICSKECPLECDSYRYDLSISFTKFNYQNAIKYLFTNTSSNQNYDFNDVVGFRVYYNDFTYTYLSQIPKMEFPDYISSIGGILGLFIGISFLSLAEILELLLEIFIIIFKKETVIS